MTDFASFADSHGLVIQDLRADGRIHRVPTAEHPRKRNGAYMWDGRRGWVMAWDGATGTQWFNDPCAKPWTEAEKRAWKARQDARRAEDARKHARAVQRAVEIVQRARFDYHGYLTRKGFPNEQGLVADGFERFVKKGDGYEREVLDDVLIVPMRDPVSNALRGAQAIFWRPDTREWVKEMIPGTQAKGAALCIGAGAEHWLVEGLATGLSVRAALASLYRQARVVVCFSAGNLPVVAEMLKGRRYVVADNDHPSKQTGVKAGEWFAARTGLPWCMPPELGSDANDMHARYGVRALADLLRTLMR